MIIRDSNTLLGSRVDTNRRIHTFSVTEEEDKNNNREGKTWSLYFTVTPVGAGDYFFYITNTGSTTLAISDIRIMCAAADVFTYEAVSGTPSYVGATTVTPVNRNLGSSMVPAATINSDTDITGLTSLGTVFFESTPIVNTRYKLKTSSNIFVTPGSALAIKAATGTALVTCVVSLSELELS